MNIPEHMTSEFILRQASFDDIPLLIDLFCNTVLTVNRKDYSQEEVEDWASCGTDPAKWTDRIETQHFMVAVDRQQKTVGFSSVTPQGYLHSLFVHKDFQNLGIASLLLEAVDQFAKDHRITEITSEVSRTARPFFEAKSYIVVEEQKRKANRLLLTNFRMIKLL